MPVRQHNTMQVDMVVLQEVAQKFQVLLVVLLSRVEQNSTGNVMKIERNTRKERSAICTSFIILSGKHTSCVTTQNTNLLGSGTDDVSIGALQCHGPRIATKNANDTRGKLRNLRNDCAHVIVVVLLA